MKSGVAAMIDAVRVALSRGFTRGRIVVAAVIDEEYASIGADALATRWTADLAVVTAWGAVAGAFLQVVVQVPTVVGLLGGRLHLSLGRGMDHVSQVVQSFLPVVAGRGVVQLSAYIDNVIASWLPSGTRRTRPPRTSEKTLVFPFMSSRSTAPREPTSGGSATTRISSGCSKGSSRSGFESH